MHVVLKPKAQKMIKVKAPFIDEISGLPIIKILDGSTYSCHVDKIKIYMQHSNMRYSTQWHRNY